MDRIRSRATFDQSSTMELLLTPIAEKHVRRRSVQLVPLHPRKELQAAAQQVSLGISDG